MTLYDDFIENSSGQSPIAAGFLHEDVWVSLLEHEEPNIVGTRLARGDRGIDALSVLDVVSGEVSAYQAKFCKKIDNTKRGEILDGFVKALSTKLKCVRWTLLVPIKLSTDEVEWLLNDLRNSACARAKDQEIKDRMLACEIRHLGRAALVSKLGRHPEIGARFLPDSKIALNTALKEAKVSANRMTDDFKIQMQSIREGMLRDRAIQQRSAVSALKILNQGWANELGMIEMHLREKNLNELEADARSLTDFANHQFNFAVLAEGLTPGASEALATTFIKARALTQTVILRQIDEKSPQDPYREAQELCTEAKRFLVRLGKVMRDLL